MADFIEGVHLQGLAIKHLKSEQTSLRNIAKDILTREKVTDIDFIEYFIMIACQLQTLSTILLHKEMYL